MKRQILPKKKWDKLQKGDIDQLQEQRKKKKIKNQFQTLLIETKKKPKNTELMEIEMDSTLTIKKLGQLKQKAQAPIGQAGRLHLNTKMNSERPGGTFKLLPAKFDAVPSASRTKSPMGMNKQCSGINKIPTKILM